MTSSPSVQDGRGIWWCAGGVGGVCLVMTGRGATAGQSRPKDNRVPQIIAEPTDKPSKSSGEAIEWGAGSDTRYYTFRPESAITPRVTTRNCNNAHPCRNDRASSGEPTERGCQPGVWARHGTLEGGGIPTAGTLHLGKERPRPPRRPSRSTRLPPLRAERTIDSERWAP